MITLMQRCSVNSYIRTELSQRLSIRRCPELIFVIDETERKARHIDDIIASLHKDDEE